MTGQKVSGYLSSDAVTKHLQKISAKPLLWTFFCLALFLGAQVLEAGHVHDSGIAHTECIKCQKDSSGAIPSTGIHVASFTFTAQSVVANAPDVTKAQFELAPIRGPPSQLL